MKLGEGILSIVLLIAAYLWMTSQVGNGAYSADTEQLLLTLGDILLHLAVYCVGAISVVVGLIWLVVSARRGKKAGSSSGTP